MMPLTLTTTDDNKVEKRHFDFGTVYIHFGAVKTRLSALF